MTWNIASECISVVVLCIIWVYSRKGAPLQTLRNKLFQTCFLTTLCAMTSNIISTIMIYNYQTVPLVLTWISTIIYFIATPLMGVAYFYYTISVIGKTEKEIRRIISWSSIPALIYFLLVLSNQFTKCIFDINLEVGYIQGPCILTTYIIFYIYCLMCVVAVRFSDCDINRSTKKILTIFPIFALIVIVIQQFLPTYILSGSAATCALLLIYLYLENKQISIDYLTELSNRQVFLEMLELRIKRKKAESFSVIVLSLKEFKQINNKFGQQNGNRCLQQIALFLKNIVNTHLLYRFSGDEFAILVEENSGKSIELLIKQIKDRMESVWVIGNYNCMISFAIGIVQYQESLNSVETIINGIEYAVSQAKKDSISNCLFCTSEMLEQIKRRDKIIDILKSRLNDNELEICFQPIFHVETAKFLMAESLLRLNNTYLNFVSPAEFIPIAEDTGLIIPMTYQVLDKVCKFIKKLLECGTEINGISINFSAVQFEDHDLISKIDSIISSNDIPYSKIKIEITESVLANNFETVKEFMTRMHKMGIRFGLDDFGTGYSNISSVLQLSWDTIKLDKSLIWSAMKDQSSEILVRHLVHAFKDLGLNILAEGVETLEQNDFAIDSGCDMIQGFLHARPMCSQDAEQILGKCSIQACEISRID